MSPVPQLKPVGRRNLSVRELLDLLNYEQGDRCVAGDVVTELPLRTLRFQPLSELPLADVVFLEPLG